MAAISSRVEDGTQSVDLLGWMGRAALELIGQSGIGYSFDPLTEDISDEYADAVKTFACVFIKRQLSSRVSAHLS